MNSQYHNISIPGRLINQVNNFDVLLSFDSTYSANIEFAQDHQPILRMDFQKLEIALGDKIHNIGHCLYEPEPKTLNGRGRLVLMDKILDFDYLFSKKKIKYFLKRPNNLRLKFKKKSFVHNDFKIYTSNLIYDLSVYKDWFDEMEKNINKEQDASKNHIENQILEFAGPQFFAFFDNYLNTLKIKVKKLNKTDYVLAGYYFRKQVWPFILYSTFMTRTNLKPKGYAGDSNLMEYIYDNEYHGNDIFSKLMHKHPIQTKASQAVRNRRDEIPLLLKKTKIDFNEKIRFLSVACGPARELMDIYLNQNDCHEVSCTLMDQDKEALMGVRKLISVLEKKYAKHIESKLINESVRSMIRTNNLEDKWGAFHFIYSMGLFDYLTKPTAKAIINKLYSILVPGGTMVIGNYHINNPDKVYMDFWCDWNLNYRDEEMMLDLLDGRFEAKQEIFFEASKTQMLLIVKKKL